MKKIFSSFLLLTMAVSLSAKCYYCDPLATNDKAQGASWDNAISVKALRRSLGGSGLNGDTIYVKGGMIQFKESADLWLIKASVTIIGGFDPAATGKVTALPHYPSATPTVFNGDINNDGIPSSGDATALIRVDYSDDNTKVITLQGVDLINTYYGTPEAKDDVTTSVDQAAALRVICGTVYVKNCHFYNHITPINRGSQCVTIVGAKLHMSDCELHDCISLTRGGLLRTRNFFIDGDSTKTQQPDCVLERCCLYGGSSLGVDQDPTTSMYGGGLHASYGPIFAINCTFANNTGYTDGGGVSGNNSGVAFISCSFLNNYCARSDDQGKVADSRNSYGSAFHLKNAPIKLANNFVLDNLDNATKQYAPMYSDGNKVLIQNMVTSGGNNVTGTLWYYKEGSLDDQTPMWQTSDLWTVPLSGNALNFATFFGTNALGNHGGCSKTVLPLKMQNGDNVKHLQELADAWCPSWTKVDASLDQRGAKRDENITCVGAVALEAGEITGLSENLQPATFNLQSSIYNILGQPVGENYKGIVIQKGKKYLIR